MPIYPALKHNKSNVCPLAIQDFKISKDNSFYLFFSKNSYILFYIVLVIQNNALILEKNLSLFLICCKSMQDNTREKENLPSTSCIQ